MNIADNRPHVPPILEARNITAGYGDVTVLRSVTIEVPAASVVAVLGPNGAGKTTLLRVLTGLVRPRDGQVFLAGKDVTGARPHSLVRRGLCHIPEGRGVFPSLTVRENLVLAAPRGSADWSDAIERTMEILPSLRSRFHMSAGQLSGGEQQMLALARAMVTSPTIVAVDEASLGLAPAVITRVYDVLARIVAAGAAVVLVEQYVDRALDFADSVYILNRGTVRFSGSADQVDRDALFEDYLGSSRSTGSR